MHKLNCMFGQGKVGGKSSTVFNLPSYTFPLFLALMHSHVAFAQKFPFCVFPFWNENIFVSLLSALFVGEMKENTRGECFLLFFFPPTAGSFGLLFVLWFCGRHWRSSVLPSLTLKFLLFLLFCSVNLNCIYSNFADSAGGLQRMQWLSKKL